MVIFEVVDPSGNIQNCSQNISIIDTIDPVILACPDNIDLLMAPTDTTPALTTDETTVSVFFAMLR